MYTKLRIKMIISILTVACFALTCGGSTMKDRLEANSATSFVFNIVALGNSGVGKSSLLNLLAGKENTFSIGHGAQSSTRLTSSKLHFLMGDEASLKMRLVDTQGLSDPEGTRKDIDHVRNMIKEIKELGHIDLFIICLDGTNPRFSPHVQSTIKLFIEIFPDFLKNSVVVFNKWTRSESHRDAFHREYQYEFSRIFSHDNIPCFFLDSHCCFDMLRTNDDGTQTRRKLHSSLQSQTTIQVFEMIDVMLVKNSRSDVRKIVETLASLFQDKFEQFVDNSAFIFNKIKNNSIFVFHNVLDKVNKYVESSLFG